jgi:predicted DNA-binding transcriptional regulator AlpA
MARTIRLVEIAEPLGVSKQRAYQTAEENGFPPPLAEDAHGRVWSRYEVQAWAKRWRREKPWRYRFPCTTLVKHRRFGRPG